MPTSEGAAGPRVVVRLYAELNDFLPPARRQRDLVVALPDGATVKSLIEDLGVPHTEVDLVLVQGRSAAFDHRPSAGDRIAAYPVFESWDIADLTRVRPAPLRAVAFILDVHLGRLARSLRMLGFDAAWEASCDDAELCRRAARDRRILITRDRGLLKRRAISHGMCVRSDRPREQLLEVVARFDLTRLARPFSRCLRCNAALQTVPVERLAGIPEAVRQSSPTAGLCPSCRRVFWPGSHWKGMNALVREVLASRREAPA